MFFIRFYLFLLVRDPFSLSPTRHFFDATLQSPPADSQFSSSENGPGCLCNVLFIFISTSGGVGIRSFRKSNLVVFFSRLPQILVSTQRFLPLPVPNPTAAG